MIPTYLGILIGAKYIDTNKIDIDKTEQTSYTWLDF